MVDVTICSSSSVDFCEMAPSQSLKDLKEVISSLTGIPVHAQILEGMPDHNGDDTLLQELYPEGSAFINVMSAGTDFADPTPVNTTPNPSVPSPITEFPSTPLSGPNAVPSSPMAGVTSGVSYQQEQELERALAASMQTLNEPKSEMTTPLTNPTPPPQACEPPSQGKLLLDLFSTMRVHHSIVQQCGVEFTSNPIHTIMHKAQRIGKPILVFPVLADHPSTTTFCLESLTMEGVAEFLNENFICWTAEMNEDEATCVNKIIRAKGYPVLIVLGKFSVAPDLVVVSALENIMDSDKLLVDLLGALEEYQALSRTMVPPPSEKQLLMEQQNKEYEESLQRDRLIAEQKEEERLSQLAAEEEERQKELAKEEALESLAKQVPEEPDASAPNTTKLNIRLPNGKRLERRFAETNTLQNVRDYVISQSKETSFVDTDFDFINSYPRQVFSDLSASLEELGLVGRALLVVEKKM